MVILVIFGDFLVFSVIFVVHNCHICCHICIIFVIKIYATSKVDERCGIKFFLHNSYSPPGATLVRSVTHVLHV